MNPGRELDALVAEKVMGINAVDWVTGKEFPITSAIEALALSEAQINQIPRYSTDIAAAWQVVEKLGGVQLSSGLQNCIACFLVDGEPDADGNIPILRRESYSEIGMHSTAHAICLAALKAVGENINEG